MNIKIANKNDLSDCIKVINRSFLTVANEFNLTRENSPTNPAFIDVNNLMELSKRADFFYYEIKGKKIGFVAIEKAENGYFYLEKLAVLPEHRHNEIGKQLVEFVLNYAKQRNGKVVSIGIIDENKRLKGWYQKLGFKEIQVKIYDHLPFTVCFMERDV